VFEQNILTKLDIGLSEISIDAGSLSLMLRYLVQVDC